MKLSFSARFSISLLLAPFVASAAPTPGQEIYKELQNRFKSASDSVTPEQIPLKDSANPLKCISLGDDGQEEKYQIQRIEVTYEAGPLFPGRTAWAIDHSSLKWASYSLKEMREFVEATKTTVSSNEIRSENHGYLDHGYWDLDLRIRRSGQYLFFENNYSDHTEYDRDTDPDCIWGCKGGVFDSRRTDYGYCW